MRIYRFEHRHAGELRVDFITATGVIEATRKLADLVRKPGRPVALAVVKIVEVFN